MIIEKMKFCLIRKLFFVDLGTSLPTETLTKARTLCKLKVRASHGVLDDPTASNEDAAALLQHCAHLGVLHFSWTHAAGCP